MKSHRDIQGAEISPSMHIDIVGSLAEQLLTQSLMAFQLSVRTQVRTVGVLGRLNERGLWSAQETHRADAAVNKLLVSQILRGRVDDRRS